jgi:hypothetical protein
MCLKDTVISFKVAKLAKELGFDIPVDHYYIDAPRLLEKEPEETSYNWNQNAGYSAPTLSLLQKWISEKYNLFLWVYPIIVFSNIHGGWRFVWNTVYLNDVKNDNVPKDKSIFGFLTYDKALDDGLFEILNYIKKK